jgi:hypothetical protein
LKSYILFLYGEFEDVSDIEFFINEIISEIASLTEIRFVVQNFKSIIVIFNSDNSPKELDDDFSLLVDLEQVSYYMLFNLNNIVSFVIPESLNNIIFKPQKTKINDELNEENRKFDLDEILEKISKNGINSISEEEKKFLDDFGF